MRILIIEDEYKLADLISSRLKREKYQVDICLDGELGQYNALNNIYDLIILNVMLPKVDGFTILKSIRDNHVNSYVLMLTARDSIDDKLLGFSDGADDYLTKPFHLEELVARVNAGIRKNSSSSDKSVITFSDIDLDIKRTLLICHDTGEEVEVMCKELLLLECLINNANQVVSREFLYDNIWGMDNDSLSNNLEAYISFIRKKLKLIGSKVGIRAVRGLGYKLEVMDEEARE